MLRVRINRPGPVRQKAELVLGLLADAIGIRLSVVAADAANEDDADLCYSAVRPKSSKQLWLPAVDFDWSVVSTDVQEINRVPFIGGILSKEGDAVIRGDILYGTWLMVTGAFESGQDRNRFGVPLARGSFAYENGLVAQPVVNRYASILSTLIVERLGSRYSPVDRWPNGARGAIVLSHDVDRPFSRPTAEHYHQRVSRDIRNLRVRATLRGLGGYVKNVLAQGDSGAQTHRDPNFGFDGWREFENGIGSKSAFYVAVRHAAEDGALWEEVNYNFRHPKLLGQLRHLAEDGWEIGLHASIACRSEPGRFELERRILAEAVGSPVRGLRHHYWALDSTRPEATLRAHAEAGFEYDSSLGFNDAPAFRRGVAFPFNPIDPHRMEALPILQIPPTVMDGGIFFNVSNQAEGEFELRRHIDQVIAVGGAVVFNWHLEQQNPGRLMGAGQALMNVLRD
ncbi:MAG: hypothetical protein HKN13_11325, partial [Rhodothermales bacterium]|nr:hypothetical protein [Rhodothermales bacterium]